MVKYRVNDPYMKKPINRAPLQSPRSSSRLKAFLHGYINIITNGIVTKLIFKNRIIFKNVATIIVLTSIIKEII